MMFITKNELDQLRRAIVPRDTESTRAAYRRGEFPRSARVKDLDLRYRWDLYWTAHDRDASIADMARGIYDRGGNDAHIDTALRQIVPRLEVIR